MMTAFGPKSLRNPALRQHLFAQTVVKTDKMTARADLNQLAGARDVRYLTVPDKYG